MEASITRTRCGVFDRIVCAVDGSAASLEAVSQAGILRSGFGTIDLVSFVPPGAVGYSIYGGANFVSETERALAAKLAEAKELCPEASSELLHGPKVARMLALLAETGTSLVAVGASRSHRSIGVVRGSVTTAMLHRAYCSVLVARPPVIVDMFPSSVVVGYDGSAGAEVALTAGRAIADRFEASLRVIAAAGASRADSDTLAGLDVDRDQRGPLEALLHASAAADLIVVGSRGLRGVRALGSISERVGHQAACSVLVVRDESAS